MITQELVKEYFTYKDGELFHNRDISQIRKGDRAGGVNCTGYMIVRIDGKRFLTHRVIFLLINGYLPEFIDHADGNQLNNKVENLRPCTKSQNNQNRKINQNSKSGIKGVCWMKDRRKWSARVSTKLKRVHLGFFDTLGEAKKAIECHRKEVHGDFARNY